MIDVVGVAVLAALTAICVVVVQKQSPEIALLLAICGGVLILFRASGALSACVDLLDRLAETGGMSPDVLQPVIKVIGISVITNIAANLCRDAKESALASAVEIAGSALALAAVLPLMTAVWDALCGLL